VLTTKAYPTGGLFGAAGGSTMQHARLREVIKTSIVPGSWDDTAGPGTISVAPQLLVVAQTRIVHDQIGSLFDQLRATNKLDAGDTGSSPAEEFRQVVYHVFDVSSSDLVRAIQLLVEPSSWDQSSGKGQGMILVVRSETAEAADAAAEKPEGKDEKPSPKVVAAPLPRQPTLLIIRQTDEGHRQILDLLIKLGQTNLGFEATLGGRGGGMF
jgi:hypothetical protein